MAISQDEIIRLAELLGKIDQPKNGLPQPVFDSLVKIVPFVACELIIEGEDGYLMTWREDEFFKGWHFPGGLLRYSEEFDDRIQKTAQKELGVMIKNYRLILTKNYPRSSRGHGVCFIFLCTINEIPKDGEYFKEMPEDIIKEHRLLWGEIANYKKYAVK